MHARENDYMRTTIIIAGNYLFTKRAGIAWLSAADVNVIIRRKFAKSQKWLVRHYPN